MRLKSIIAICVLWTGAYTVQAQPANRFLLSAGWLHFASQGTSSSVEDAEPRSMLQSSRMPIFGLDGSKVAVPHSNSAGITATYFLDDHWAGEFMLGIAPELNVYGAGKWSEMGKLGTVQQWSPALLLKYYFLNETSQWRPYAGIGLSRSWFKNAHFDNALYEGSFGDAAAMSMSAKNTWNAVFNAGLMYQFHKHWFGGVSISYMPLQATATITSHTEGIGTGDSIASYQTHVKLNPVITFVHIGYRF